jgi:hypothetical protein
MDLNAVGKMSDLRDDLTPFQLGTTGLFDKKRFDIVGRLKVGYQNGFWNEWYCLFGDGIEAWLAEAQGFYGFCFPVLDWLAPELNSLAIGKWIDIGNSGSFQVEDMHRVFCIYSEGELPLSAVEGRRSTSVDLSNDDGEMATIEYAAAETRVFVGDYKDFDEFQFENLRHIDGW